MSWRRATPLILDGLAWGVPPDRLLQIIAGATKTPALEAVRRDLQAGQPFAAALEARGAPVELVEAARVGATLNDQAAVGLRSRAAAAGTISDRIEVLGGLFLPLVTLGTIASAAASQVWVDLVVDPPVWVPWTARILSLLGLVLAIGLAVPVVGRFAGRLPGLGWIGRRRRAARMADLLALALRDGGDPAAVLEQLNAARVAHAITSGTPLPEALRRHPDGRPLSRALEGLGPASWPIGLRDAAARLAAEAERRSAVWASGLRIGGTLAAAALATAWLLWIYSGFGTLPTRMVGS